jgi:ribosomal protein S18 acetylase RimI-like enzyme
MPIDIKPATFERVPELAGLLGRAFADDPMFLWPLGSRASADRITGFFRIFDERLSPLGWLWEAGNGAGVAGWIPPGSDAEMMEIDRELRPEIAVQTEDGGHRYEAMWEWIAEHFPDEPFWYLDHIGVAADRRRAGVGTALIRHGLAFADRDGLPAFLETGRPENVAYYERRGFRTTDHAAVPGGGPPIWFMRYDP